MYSVWAAGLVCRTQGRLFFFFEYVLAKPLMIIYPDRVFAKLHL